MTATGDPGNRAVVTPLRRPPVRQSVVVRAPLRHTFETFVRTIGIWWPVQPFSAGQERVRDIALEQREGGRVYEIWDDGTEASWGELRSWSPPDGFVMTWQGTPVPTEVELSFTALGPELTRVTVEHRGWDSVPAAHVARHGFPNAVFLQRHAEWWQALLEELNAYMSPGGGGRDPTW